MLHTLATTLAAVVSLSPAAPDTADAIDTARSGAAATASQAFAADLLRVMNDGSRNTFVSPYSIQTAMWMAGSGAKGVTREEIRRGLRLGDEAAVNESLRGLQKVIAAAGNPPKLEHAPDNFKPLQLRSVNKLWHSGGFDIHETYTTLLKHDFDADRKELDFSEPKDAAKAINSWVSTATEKRIEKLIEPPAIPPRGLILTNAVYFKGGWKDTFTPINEMEFTNAAGKVVKPPAMVNQETYAYQKLATAQVVVLPYHGDAHMTIVLPERGAFAATLAGLDLGAINPQRSGKVAVTMPRFKTGQHSSMVTTLQKIGITAAFDPSLADFSGITDSKPAYISEVIHAANIDVDENGSEAAAATAVIMGVSAAVEPARPIVFTVDRPFIFSISNSSTGAVLFAGVVNDPS